MQIWSDFLYFWQPRYTLHLLPDLFDSPPILSHAHIHSNPFLHVRTHHSSNSPCRHSLLPFFSDLKTDANNPPSQLPNMMTKLSNPKNTCGISVYVKKTVTC